LTDITVERIKKVHDHINDAVVKTSERSTLSKPEQDALLAQGCAEACDLLESWLDSGWWGRLRPADGGLVAECVASQEDFEKFLDPMFSSAMERAGQSGVGVPRELIDEARKAVANIGRRYRKMSRADLYQVANARVGELKRSVCRLADEFRQGRQDEAKRRRARTVLAKVKNVLMHLAIVVTVGPPQATADAAGPAQAIMIAGIAQTAQPGVTITPPDAGPTVG
jgi:hypothetical protein